MSFVTDYLMNVSIYLDSSLGILLFIFIYIFAVLLLLPASWLSLVGGFLYGPYIGSLIVFVSAFLAASLSFFIAKQYFSSRITKILKKFSRLTLLEGILKKGGLKLIVFTRLSPLFPFSILNYFYGLNNISYKNFSISLLCILPGTYLYCSVGSLANNLNDIKNMRVSSNLLTTIISITSTALVIYFLTKYANEIIQESSNN